MHLSIRFRFTFMLLHHSIQIRPKTDLCHSRFVTVCFRARGPLLPVCPPPVSTPEILQDVIVFCRFPHRVCKFQLKLRGGLGLIVKPTIISSTTIAPAILCDVFPTLESRINAQVAVVVSPARRDVSRWSPSAGTDTGLNVRDRRNPTDHNGLERG